MVYQVEEGWSRYATLKVGDNSSRLMENVHMLLTTMVGDHILLAI